MNKKVLVFSAVFVLVVVVGVVFLLNNSSDSNNDNISVQNTQNNSDTTPAPVQMTDNSVPGEYVDYSETVIADTSGTKLLFFHASWCVQCRYLENDILAKGVPEDVTIIKIDYDSNQSLRQKYGVTLQTTVVLIDDEGNLVNKYVAYEDPTLDSVKANLL